jgi:hypothetical protein
MIAPIDVELSNEENVHATRIGHQRYRHSAGYALKHGGGQADALKIDIVGALGELAFCKAVGFVWPPVRHDIQVRTAPCKAKRPPPGFGTLIVRADDDDRDRFVLVIGNAPHFRVVGWIGGWDAKRDRFIKQHADRPEAWFVPASDLHTDLTPVSPK